MPPSTQDPASAKAFGEGGGEGVVGELVGLGEEGGF
jgi:hypothetical protein